MRKISISGLKEKVWKEFARYIKVRDADTNGYVKCCTCKVQMHWRESQAGHFVCGRNNTVLFDDRIVHAQCARCNGFGGGEQYKYSLFMMEKGYTREELEELNNLKFATKKFSREELNEMHKTYKEEADKIQMEKGI